MEGSSKISKGLHLLEIRAIKPVPLRERGKGVYFGFFLLLKKNGDMTGTDLEHNLNFLDLKWLNYFLQKEKFKMETWCLIIASLEKGDFLTSADLLEAYLHVPISPRLHKYLGFCYGNQYFPIQSPPLRAYSCPKGIYEGSGGSDCISEATRNINFPLLRRTSIEGSLQGTSRER